MICPPHDWLFEEPHGEIVRGECRQCGAQTERPSVPATGYAAARERQVQAKKQMQTAEPAP